MLGALLKPGHSPRWAWAWAKTSHWPLGRPAGCLATSMDNPARPGCEDRAEERFSADAAAPVVVAA